jgi:hypothetical protein
MAVGLLALLAPAGLLAACGGSDGDSSPLSSSADAADADETADTVGASDSTVINLDDITIPAGAGISEECAAVYQKFIVALGSASTGQDFEGLQAAIGSLNDVVPGDLQDDVETLSAAYGELAAVIDDFDGDFAAAMADPAAQERMNAIGTAEVTAAGDAISAYFTTACPGAEG